ncbi:MAG: SMI1/KNR4 family protein [Saprospiraceae bacterium]|nr:SMI1/KNR4 family protein [Saprospiraceae bacterium]
MKIEIKNQGELLSEKSLKEYERRLPLKIPNQYRDFMLKINGGMPTLGFFKIIDGNWSEEISVERFLGKNSNVYFDIAYNIQLNKSILPRGFFPIALVGGSSLVCIQTRGNEKGKVYFWDSQEIDGKLNKTYFIANSFNEFIVILENSVSN